MLNKSQEKHDNSAFLVKTVSINSQYKQLYNYYYNYNYDINDPSFHLPPISNRSTPLSDITYVNSNSRKNSDSSNYINKNTINKSNNKKIKKTANQQR